MSQGERPGGPARVYVDPDRRSALMDLLDDGFPAIAPRIGVASAAGWSWDAVTEPFVRWDGDRAVGHVGVLIHRIRLAGQTVEVAGIHAVCTRSSHRNRGVARGLLAEACSWVDARFATAKLFTDVPEVYAPHGFREVPMHVFHVERAGGSGGARPLRPDEAGRFRDLCADRAPTSDVFASLDSGWLVGIDLALQRRTHADLCAVDALDAVVDWRLDGDTLRLHDVFARELPTLEALTRFAPPHARVVLSMTPDLLAPDAVPERVPGPMMVRGEWPVPADVPLGVSPLAEQ